MVDYDEVFIILLGTSYAEFQSVDINLQELRTGQQKLREMLEGMQREQKQLDLIMMTYKVEIFLSFFGNLFRKRKPNLNKYFRLTMLILNPIR